MSIPVVQPATLVRYVLICGLENSSGLEVDDAGAMVGQGTISNQKRQLEIPGSGGGRQPNPLERSYKPRILRHYPDMTTWSHFNPEAVSRLVLPQGLRFCTDRELESGNPGGTKCHPFVVTKEDGERSFGVSCVFYEKVVDTNICQAVHTLLKMYHQQQAETSGGGVSLEAGSGQDTPDAGRQVRLLIEVFSFGSQSTINVKKFILKHTINTGPLFLTVSMDIRA